MNHLITCLVLGLLLAVAPPATRARAELQDQDADCQRDFRGIEYCTTDDGRTHIVRIDLRSRNLRFYAATASNAQGPNPPAWTDNKFQTVAQMAAAHATNDGLPLAVAINGDYFGPPSVDNPSHGWQGLLVQGGQRLDGPAVDAPDCDCAFLDRSSLTLSRSQPTQAEIGKRPVEAFDQYALYRVNCSSQPVFASCRDEVLNRTPAPEEETTYDRQLENAWYTAISGGPLIVREGQWAPISQACSEEGFRADWCADNPDVSQDRLRQLKMGTVAGLTQDGRGLILITTTNRLPNELSQLLAAEGAWTGLRFDGSHSAQLFYDGRERTGNTRGVGTALLVYASPLPDYAASPAAPIVFDIVVAGEAANLELRVRNEGRATWTGPDYWLALESGNLPGAPAALAAPGTTASGEIAEWQVQAQTSGVPAIRSVRYRMQHSGEPFGDVITGYVIVLPEELRDLEADIRQQIDEWVQQGGQAVEDLMRDILQRIQEELEQQAASFLEELLAGCTGPGAALGLVALVFLRRRRAK
jgi:hypothetical protein